MDFELRIIADCPNSDPAGELYRRALEAEGLDAGDLRIRELASDEEARELAFHGSPTFVVSGRDLFASAAEPALSCRVYPAPEGFAGLPSLEDLRAALRDAGETGPVAQ
ncbi:hypothetical protein ACFY5D_15215 [Paeniglutamicibacter sp. NPDC012692]|uniref:hypothetical protein n=1 Tax=Paeniglutamicibacter sp. NPDC012692 TaxID=3364388 RepID=UPI0036C5CCF5